jgi:hypothetical protein
MKAAAARAFKRPETARAAVVIGRVSGFIGTPFSVTWEYGESG